MYLINKNEKIEILSIEECVRIYNKKEIKTVIVNSNYYLTGSSIIENTCKKCGKTFQFQFRFNVDRLYKNICKNCFQKETFLNNYGVDSPAKLDSFQRKRIFVMKEKYGSSNNIEKIKQTKIEKYGCSSYHNIEQMKKTNIKKYGVENPFQSKTIQEKIKQTNIEKYGEKNVWESKEIQKKIKLINIEKYGVDNYWKSKKFLDSVKIPYIKNIFESYKNIVEPLFSIEEYKTSNDFYKWKCCKCGNEFEDYLMNKHIPRCLSCYPYTSGCSNMEKELVDWLKSLNIQIEENNRTIIKPLELDVYIPSHNSAIEFNGLYWHSELQGKDSKYHINKTKLCQEKNIQLLHVFEDEWIEKQDIVKSIIKNKLSLYDRIIYGRKCIVKEISSKEANKFYNENHIQGSYASSINLGLFYEEELVSCLSFSKPRYNKKYDWEITRFANKLNTKVHGSFGKLWKNKPEGSIITYSDKRLFTGSIYQKYMTQLVDSKPAYWYVKEGHRYSRIEFQKHKLASVLASYDSSLTEWENMQLNGYDRIWDCGNWVFEFK